MTDISVIPRSVQSSAWRVTSAALRVALTLASLLIGAAVVLGWYRHMPTLEDTRWRVLLTMLGVAVGAWLLRIQVAAVRRATLPAVVGVVALLASQVCYYALVWGEWKAHTPLWRAWWVAVCVAVGATHLVWVRLLIGGPILVGGAGSHVKPWVRFVARFTAACIMLSVALTSASALGSTPLPELGLPQILSIAIPVGGSLLGTAVLVVDSRRKRKRRLTLAGKIGWLAGAAAALFGVGFYSGRITAPEPGAMDLMPSALAHFSQDELRAQLDADLKQLKVLTAGQDELTARSRTMTEQLTRRLAAEQRALYHPAEEDEIRAAFMSYLAYRAALLRLAATYTTFTSVPDPELRARAFLVGYASGAAVYRASLALVTTYRAEVPARRKLNEPDAACGIGPDTFEAIYLAGANDRNASKVAEMAAYYESKRDEWRAAEVLAPEDFDWVDRHIRTCVAEIRGTEFDRGGARFEQLVRRVKHDSYTPVYAAQSVVSTLIGDTKMVARGGFIAEAQILQMRGKLRPGDILLERRNWFMSNAFLPGFWPHGALYVGEARDLERLGLIRRDDSGKWTSDDPAIRDRLDEYLESAHDGMPHTVIESVSEGVIFNSLTESMSADYVAVLRPRKLSDADKARAVARAFAHVGKPYDFEFDFFSADRLVCTELLYRAYDVLITFDLVPIMGRMTLPALEIAKKYQAERASSDRDLDFVMFLDAVPSESRARLATEEEFLATIHRPRAFNE